jgi:3D (Asp-Asp-Asp) domain-containing protein
MITIQYCGEQMRVSSYGESLEALCNRLGLNATGAYVPSVPLQTKTYDGMEVTIDCVVEMAQTYTVEIPFETVRCDDPNLPKGEERVMVAGVSGQMLRTANVVYTNSQEVSHTVVEETVVKQPVEQLIAVGTGEAVDLTAASRKPVIGDGVIITGDGQRLTYSRSAQFTATAYTHTDAGCNMTTATGTTVRIGTVAVDPKVIPYGTRMFIVSNDGKYVYGVSVAEDCGGAIKEDRMDLYFPTEVDCLKFGVRGCTVYFLD